MRLAILVPTLVLLMAPSLLRAQARARMGVWHGGKPGPWSMRWSQDGNNESWSATERRRFVEPGDSVCVDVPNAHPIFYNYSIAAETLKVKSELPAAPLLLLLSGMGAAPGAVAAKARFVGGTPWYVEYADRLDELSTAIALARAVAKASDAADQPDASRSNLRIAVDSIRTLFSTVPQTKAGESLEKAMARWYEEALKGSKDPVHVNGLPQPAPVPAATTTNEVALKAATDTNYAALAVFANELRGELAQATQGTPEMLKALKAYADVLFALQQSFGKTWNGDGSTFTACQVVGTETLIIRVLATIKDSASAKARHTGRIASFTVVPKYREARVAMTPMFAMSLVGDGEPDYQLRDGAVVDLGDSKLLAPRPAMMISFTITQTGEDESIVWRLGLGSNVASDTDKLERLFGAFTIGYRDVLGVGFGFGRVHRQRLNDASILGKPLPAGKTLESYLMEPESKPALYLLLNFSNVDMLGGLGKLFAKK